MKISETDLLLIIDNLRQNLHEYPSQKAVVEFIRKNFRIQSNEVLEKKIKKFLRKYKKINSKSKRSWSSERPDDSDRKGDTTVIDTDDFLQCNNEPGARGDGPNTSKKRRKSFIDLGERMQKDRTDRLLLHMEELISKQCLELNVTQMCGYFIHRVNKQSNQIKA